MGIFSIKSQPAVDLSHNITYHTFPFAKEILRNAKERNFTKKKGNDMISEQKRLFRRFLFI